MSSPQTLPAPPQGTIPRRIKGDFVAEMLYQELCGQCALEGIFEYRGDTIGLAEVAAERSRILGQMEARFKATGGHTAQDVADVVTEMRNVTRFAQLTAFQWDGVSLRP